MSVEPLFASLYKGGGLPQGKPEGFSQKIDFKKKVLRCLIPQSTHFVRRQLLTGESPLCRSATFPHTVGNYPIQGSLNKSLSLLTSFADSSLFKGAYLSPLFLPENHRKNVQNRVQYLSKSSKLENVNNLFIILQQHCQFCLPLLPKNNNSICSIQKINKFV